eukprot:symbB.v1.2.004692.t1/scaffold269.1/size246462/2
MKTVAVKAYYFASFTFFATYERYATLYFEADGFHASQIGVLIAVRRALQTLGTPLWNAMADKTKKARSIQLACLVASSIPFLALSVPVRHDSRGLVLRGLALWMFSFIGSPSTSMMDAIALAACDQDAQRWGDARIYGAIGWGMAHLPLGMMLDRYGFCVMFVSFALAAVGLFWATMGMPEACGDAEGDVSVSAIWGILRNNMAFFCNITVLGAGFAMVEGMLFLLLQEMNASTLLCGLSVVVTVIFELPIFARAQWLLSTYGTRKLIVAAQIAWVVRAAFYWQMSTAWMVLLVEPLHGVTFALAWTAAIDFVKKPEVSGEGLEASAQGLLTACFHGLGPIIGLLGGGLLFDALGGHNSYLVFAIGVMISGWFYWRGELLTDGALDAMDCAQHAQKAAASAFALSHTGDCYSYLMTVTASDFATFQELGTRSSCSEGFFIWNDLPNYDFYVMQPSNQWNCPFGIMSGENRHRDKRRLAVVRGGVVSSAGGSSLIPAGIEQMFTALGMAPVGQGLRSVTELYLQGRASLLSQAVFQTPGKPSPHLGGVSAYKAQLEICDGPLGLVVTEPRPPMQNLLILKIEDSKAIQLWNRLNPAKQIQVGHAIMTVNGKSDPHLMFQELQTAETLNLFIKDKLTRVQQRHFDQSFQDQEERRGYQ